jgi:NAD(P)-dependent dehydrogenase (short-subunit alcohol dehydrogenase family)
MSLQGRTAVVTGGGRGIGAAVACSLADAGAMVLVAARTRGEIDAVATVVGGRALTCDVTDPASVAALAAAAGRVDILVNSAGIASSAPLNAQTVEEWNRLFAVNVTGTFLCTQAFLPGMVKRTWGRVINIASVAGLTGAAYISAYSATKHAVVGFTRSVAAEVAAHGITVNAVCPGYVNTPMTEQSIRRIMEKTGMAREKALASILEMSPQRRLIEPEEVAHAVLALCHENGRGVNGQAIVIDGG